LFVLIIGTNTERQGETGADTSSFPLLATKVTDHSKTMALGSKRSRIGKLNHIHVRSNALGREAIDPHGMANSSSSGRPDQVFDVRQAIQADHGLG
jgi:hypothetical protein